MNALDKGTYTNPTQATKSTQRPESTKEESAQTFFDEPLPFTKDELILNSCAFVQFVKNTSEIILEEFDDDVESQVFTMWNGYFDQTRIRRSSNPNSLTTKKLFNFISDPEKLPKSKKQNDTSHDNNISMLDWNASGSLLVVVYGSRDNVGLSRKRGLLELWDVSDDDVNTKVHPEKPVARFEVESELSCVAAHPTNPDRIAVGSKNGKILIFDFVDDDLKLYASSKIGEYFHEAAVTSLAWYKKDNDWSLYSTGLDSKLLMWKLTSKLSYPFYGNYLQLKCGGRRSNRLLVGNSITIFSEGGNNDAYLIIGCDCGHLLASSHNINTAPFVDVLENNTMKWSPNARHLLMNIDSSHRQKVIKKAENYAKLKKRKGVDCRTLQDMRIPPSILYPPLSFSSRQHHLGRILSVEYYDRGLLSTGEDGVLKIYNISFKHCNELLVEVAETIDISSQMPVANFCPSVSRFPQQKHIIFNNTISLNVILFAFTMKDNCKML